MSKLVSPDASTRGRIISAAREQFRVHGIVGTSLDEVSRAAGVHRATLHRTFPGGRDELVAEAIVAAGIEAVARTRWRMDDAPTVIDGMADVLAAVVMIGRADPVVCEAISSVSADLVVGGRLLEPLAAATESWWHAVIDRAEREGARWADARPERVIDHVARTLISLVREPGMASGPDDVRAYLADFLIPVVLHRR